MKYFGFKIYFLPVILILIIFILQYAVNVKYKFPEPHAFNGEFLYNPYNGMDSTKWEKANFHAHTHLFVDLTNGTASTNQVLDSFYTYFDYRIINISNYQAIDSFESKNRQFVPVYEHGYQYHKNHQLVLNAKKINWHDYFFRQTLSNKQFILNNLKEDSSVIVTIVHPLIRSAYLLNDFRYLSNYNCLEIVNNRLFFTSYYDTILSAGHPVFLMADDDTHDVAKMNDGCHSFNLINADLVKDSILHSLKTGCSVGVNFNVSSYRTNEEKKTGLLKLPKIKSVTLDKDTLTVNLSKAVRTIRFIGQNGVERKTITNVSMGSYIFGKEDTYIRTEVECKDGTIYFFNPVFRYDGIHLTDYAPSPDLFKTWMWRLMVFVFIFLSFSFRRFAKLREVISFLIKLRSENKRLDLESTVTA